MEDEEIEEIQEIMRCPFDGDDAVYSFDPTFDRPHAITCTNCGILMRDDFSRGYLTSMWNTRAKLEY